MRQNLRKAQRVIPVTIREKAENNTADALGGDTRPTRRTESLRVARVRRPTATRPISGDATDATNLAQRELLGVRTLIRLHNEFVHILIFYRVFRVAFCHRQVNLDYGKNIRKLCSHKKNRIFPKDLFSGFYLTFGASYSRDAIAISL